MHMCNFCCIFAPKLFNYTMSSTKAQLIEELKVLLEQDVTAVKDQVEHIKTLFYKDGADGQEAESEGEEFAALEEQFKAIMAEYKAKKAEAAAKTAKEQEANLARKQAILAEMKTLAEGETDGVIANLQRMRELQAEWKTIGAVPADKVQETRKDYQKYQEQFYDLVKINIELRDLDFKKNLEMKTLLCEAAERLENNENIVEASRALQQLHDEWAEIGPVARELREDLWNRFKAASTIINKKHQAHFDELHAKEQANLDAKRAIIVYTVPELSDPQATEVPVTLLAGSEKYPVYEVTDRLDTVADYTSAFTGFSKYSVSVWQFMEMNVVRDRYLNVGFSYIADELGKTCMAPNHISNDTIYLDFLLKKKGDSKSSGTGMNCYDLNSLRYNPLINYSQLQPKDDSICVTVTMKATTGITEDRAVNDSRTVKISY